MQPIAVMFRGKSTSFQVQVCSRETCSICMALFQNHIYASTYELGSVWVVRYWETKKNWRWMIDKLL